MKADMNIKETSLGQRLAIGFGFVITLFIIVAGLAYLRIGSLNGEINLMVKDRYPETVLADQVKAQMNEVSRSMLSVLIMTDPTQIKNELANIDRQNAATNETMANLGKRIIDPKGLEYLQNILQIREKFLPAQTTFVGLINDDNKDDALVKLMFSVRPLQTKYFKALDDFIGYQNSQMESAGDQSSHQATQTEMWILTLALAAGFISVVIAILVTRSITRPLNAAVDIAKRVAQGDLTSNIILTTRDETGQMMEALKDMNESLVRIVSEVRSGTDTIVTASSEIASGNLDLSNRTEEQATSLAETASSMKELTATVKQNADNARQANQLAASASEVAEQGGSVVAQVISTMGSINESSKKIVDIISVIDGIAFQTNILALNAAVEAARAGEQGRGFAVVASEVRNLAQRSAGAAKEIKALIGDSVDKVATGSDLVSKAGITMDEVVASVKRVTDIMAEITAATVEQSAGIEQVNRAIAQMDGVTQQNAALVEEAAAAAESMQNQAGNLTQVVSVFKLNVQHNEIHVGHAAAPRPKLVKVAPVVRAPSRTLASARANLARPVKVMPRGESWDEF